MRKPSVSDPVGFMSDMLFSDVIKVLVKDKLKDYGYIDKIDEEIAYEDTIKDLQEVLVELVMKKREKK